MALGTLTPVRGMSFAFANKRARMFTVQLSAGANYTTGGETITAAAVGLKKIDAAIPMGNATTSSGTTSRTVVVLLGNGVTTTKLLTQTTASAEAASNSDQSTFSVNILFIGY